MHELHRVLSANVRRLRRRAGLSQEGLAARADLHRTYVGAIERGERNITIQSLYRLAKALNVPADALLRESAGEQRDA